MRSMTGFGKASAEFNGKKFSVEIRSLNSRQLDLSLRIPSAYKEIEQDFRSVAGSFIERGKADVHVSVESSEQKSAVSINKDLVRHYFSELSDLKSELKEETDLLPLILKMPEVLTSAAAEPDVKEFETLKQLLKTALNDFDSFRKKEGDTLERDLLDRVQLIRDNLIAVEPHEKVRTEQIRTRLLRNIEENVPAEKVDHDRFEQELIYYFEKLDITEEKTRLLTHCKYFNETAAEPSSGRKLGFISQEMGREINTIGSKANNAELQKIVVKMKDELEKIKEQLNNIL